MRTTLFLLTAALIALPACGGQTTDSSAPPAATPASASSAEEPKPAGADAKKPEPHSADDGHGHGAKPEDMSPEELEKAKAEARDAIQRFYTEYKGIAADEIEVFAWDGTKGADDAKVTVIEYADFDCPHCKLAAFYTQDLVHRYGDRVKFVFKNYPLGKDCNDSLKNDVHPNSCRAAVGVVCAGRQGKFWQQHDGTFDKQGSLSKRAIKGIAKDIGLDMDRFNECLEAPGPWDDVKSQVLQGRSLGLSGTPAFYVNGKALPSPHPLMIEAAIRSELRGMGVTELPEDKDNLFGES